MNARCKDLDDVLFSLGREVDAERLTPASLLAALRRRQSVDVFSYTAHQHHFDRITIGGRFAGHRLDGEFYPADGFTTAQLERALRRRGRA